ncbi:MAG: DUF4013 domain-containing protein [Thermomicrobium sp.]|nr:DUF4013 domain-containing protein [Thermomicrobium sp.]
MDLGRAFTAMFRDERWTEKLLVAALLPLVPIAGSFLVFGWALRYLAHVVAGQDTELPEWNDWGGDLVRGLLAAIVSLVWFAPALLVLACSALALVPVFAKWRPLSTVGLVVSLTGFFCLLPVLFALASVLLPLPISRLALTGKLGAGLAVRATFAEARRAVSDLLVAWLVGVAYALVLSFVVQTALSFGFLLCVVGIVAAFLVSAAFQVHWTLVSVHLWGQIRARLDRPVEPTPPEAWLP